MRNIRGLLVVDRFWFRSNGTKMQTSFDRSTVLGIPRGSDGAPGPLGGAVHELVVDQVNTLQPCCTRAGSLPGLGAADRPRLGRVIAGKAQFSLDRGDLAFLDYQLGLETTVEQVSPLWHVRELAGECVVN